ncbi:unnamed protein product [Amoebophrya sp. A120]|nr:unnamed protein product [Amoebophrya sp. A120]|eukprot:GSA120T00001798001.1
MKMLFPTFLLIVAGLPLLDGARPSRPAALFSPKVPARLQQPWSARYEHCKNAAERERMLGAMSGEALATDVHSCVDVVKTGLTKRGYVDNDAISALARAIHADIEVFFVLDNFLLNFAGDRHSRPKEDFWAALMRRSATPPRSNRDQGGREPQPMLVMESLLKRLEERRSRAERPLTTWHVQRLLKPLYKYALKPALNDHMYADRLRTEWLPIYLGGPKIASKVERLSQPDNYDKILIGIFQLFRNSLTGCFARAKALGAPSRSRSPSGRSRPKSVERVEYDVPCADGKTPTPFNRHKQHLQQLRSVKNREAELYSAGSVRQLHQVHNRGLANRLEEVPERMAVVNAVLDVLNEHPELLSWGSPDESRIPSTWLFLGPLAQLAAKQPGNLAKKINLVLKRYVKSLNTIAHNHGGRRGPLPRQAGGPERAGRRGPSAERNSKIAPISRNLVNVEIQPSVQRSKSDNGGGVLSKRHKSPHQGRCRRRFANENQENDPRLLNQTNRDLAALFGQQPPPRAAPWMQVGAGGTSDAGSEGTQLPRDETLLRPREGTSLQREEQTMRAELTMAAAADVVQVAEDTDAPPLAERTLEAPRARGLGRADGSLAPRRHYRPPQHPAGLTDLSSSSEGTSERTSSLVYSADSCTEPQQQLEMTMVPPSESQGETSFATTVRRDNVGNADPSWISELSGVVELDGSSATQERSDLTSPRPHEATLRSAAEMDQAQTQRSLPQSPQFWGEFPALDDDFVGRYGDDGWLEEAHYEADELVESIERMYQEAMLSSDDSLESGPSTVSSLMLRCEALLRAMDGVRSENEAELSEEEAEDVDQNATRAAWLEEQDEVLFRSPQLSIDIPEPQPELSDSPRYPDAAVPMAFHPDYYFGSQVVSPISIVHPSDVSGLPDSSFASDVVQLQRGGGLLTPPPGRMQRGGLVTPPPGGQMPFTPSPLGSGRSTPALSTPSRTPQPRRGRRLSGPTPPSSGPSTPNTTARNRNRSVPSVRPIWR